jgi:hypothetical protein
MSVARELLERWLDDTIFESEELDSLMEETRELLAQPEQEPFAVVANNSVGFDVSHSPQGMPLVWLGKLEHGDKLYRVRARDE